MSSSSSTPLSEDALLAQLGKLQTISNSKELCSQLGWNHVEFESMLRRLASWKYLSFTTHDSEVYDLNAEAKEIVEFGSTEARVFNKVPAEGILKVDLDNSLPANVVKIGWGQCMKLKWLRLEKGSNKVFRQVDSIQDTVAEQLRLIRDRNHSSISVNDLKNLQKRQLITPRTEKTYSVTKGEEFSLTFKKPQADLTHEMLVSGSWKNTAFKEINYDAFGSQPDSGHLHLLMKARTEYREIFLEMGFEEMPTNNWVESSFWNFDALFQPQQHPVRDAHDTFFLIEPEFAQSVPQDYMEKVKKVHQEGGYGSIGWRYNWKIEEAKKNILRTHTTAVSARMLYALAQQKEFTPKKYFSIDRVFRNEAVDATHLAEFHQIEGLIADRNLTLGNLMGVLREFFWKLGIKQLRFKPAYNPYTEPSMEVFSYHSGLKRWVEIGNSGVFRPEMLQAMGLPSDVSVIAWGLSLERPTMIRNNIKNIRELVGHKVEFKTIRENPLCRLDK